MCVDGRRNSFQAGDAIFVLLCSDLEKRDQAIGTAFAVRCDSMNKLITAAHCVVEKKKVIGAEFCICLNIERVGHGYETSEKIPVTVTEHGKTEAEDWAVLEVTTKGFQFSYENTLAICPLDQIPAKKATAKYKIYHCPCGDFNEGRSYVLECCETDWHKPYVISRRVGVMNFYFGLSSGSSGGCVVDESGRVVAFHVASSSSAFTFEEATKVAAETKKQQMQQQQPQTTTKSGRVSSKRAATEEVDVELIDSVSEAFKSHASSYAALNTCIIVSFHPKLEKALGLISKEELDIALGLVVVKSDNSMVD
jgi:V8-like Glu-specific endopeptidase